MTDAPPEVTEEMAAAKWHSQIAPFIDAIHNRMEDPEDFRVTAESELAADDAATSPYQVSHAARWCLNATVNNLHALKTLIVDNQMLYSAASYGLARGALECAGSGFWILDSESHEVRTERGLRWWTTNLKDQDRATRDIPGHTSNLEPRLEVVESLAAAANCDLSKIRFGYSSTEAMKHAQEHSSATKPYFYWQICSGFAHGRPWANIAMNVLEQTPTAEDGVTLARLTSDHRRLLGVTMPAINLLQDVLRLYSERSGVNPEKPQ